MEACRSKPSINNAWADFFSWLLVGALGVGGLYLAFVHAPPRIRLPVLAPLALGALTGWALGKWAAARRIESRSAAAIVATALIVAGQAGVAVETHRLGVPAIRAALSRQNLELGSIADGIEQGMIESAQDDETRKELMAAHEDAHRRRDEEERRNQRSLTFPGYLESRIPPQWGRWSPPWPELFWGIEVVTAGLLGGWTAARTLRAERRGASDPRNLAPSAPSIG